MAVVELFPRALGLEVSHIGGDGIPVYRVMLGCFSFIGGALAEVEPRERPDPWTETRSRRMRRRLARSGRRGRRGARPVPRTIRHPADAYPECFAVYRHPPLPERWAFMDPMTTIPAAEHVIARHNLVPVAKITRYRATLRCECRLYIEDGAPPDAALRAAAEHTRGQVLGWHDRMRMFEQRTG